MNWRLAFVAVSVLLAACVPPSPAPAPAPGSAASAAPPAPPPQPVSTATIPIRSLSCTELLGATDDDRAAASLFFTGYRAALAHVHNLSISQIEAIEETALASCAATPTKTASQAFAEALAANKK
jgi:hypothetical protein